MSIADFLESVASENHRSQAVSIPHDIQRMRLMEYRTRLNAPCPFRVGQFVRPRKESNLKGGDGPNIVVEVFPKPHRHFGDDASDQTFGYLFTMRIALFRNGPDCEIIITWTVNHADYEAVDV